MAPPPARRERRLPGRLAAFGVLGTLRHDRHGLAVRPFGGVQLLLRLREEREQRGAEAPVGDCVGVEHEGLLPTPNTRQLRAAQRGACQAEHPSKVEARCVTARVSLLEPATGAECERLRHAALVVWSLRLCEGRGGSQATRSGVGTRERFAVSHRRSEMEHGLGRAHERLPCGGGQRRRLVRRVGLALWPRVLLEAFKG
mmetsp:Transcript_31085/g.92889  ORF Transcript_31085/g.92889 Transcript_31085/m.92889 type:complete len:200 (+) Transcript_31085:962-1561(+)